jgi:hypothetical protein
MPSPRIEKFFLVSSFVWLVFVSEDKFFPKRKFVDTANDEDLDENGRGDSYPFYVELATRAKFTLYGQAWFSDLDLRLGVDSFPSSSGLSRRRSTREVTPSSSLNTNIVVATVIASNRMQGRHCGGCRRVVESTLETSILAGG